MSSRQHSEPPTWLLFGVLVAVLAMVLIAGLQTVRQHNTRVNRCVELGGRVDGDFCLRGDGTAVNNDGTR